MKTYLTYGLFMTLGVTLLSLVLFFFGFHGEIEKLKTGNLIAMIGGLLISVTVLVLGIKARRAEVPASEAFGYGRALGAGVMIALFAGLFGIVTNYVYTQMINPGYNELLVQAQITAWEEAGMSGAQIEQAEGMMRKMMNPLMQAVFGIVMTVFWGTVISLVIAAFLKRPATEEPPALVA